MNGRFSRIGGHAAAGFVLAMGAIALAEFLPGNLVVLRVGDGAGPVTESAQPLFLDEFDAETGAFVESHPIPSTGAAALTLGGHGEHDGHLNVSSNGKYILVAGYRAEAGDDDPVPHSPGDVNRVIGRVDGKWNVDTSTALSDAYDQTYITAVASDDGLRFWTAGDGKYLDLVNGRADDDFKVPTVSGGLRFISGLGATTSINVSQTQTIPGDLDADLWPDSIRSCRIVNGQMYIETPAPESFVHRGAFATMDPLPTSGPQTMIPVITNAPPSTDTSGRFVPKSDVVLLDLSPIVAGIDTAYSTGGKADYQKWSLIGGAWVRVANQTLVNSSEEINALDAVANGSTVTLFAVTDQGVYRLTDTGGYNAGLSESFGGALIAVGDDTEFRGVALLGTFCPTILASDPDGFVDLGDFAVLQACFSGNGALYGKPDCARFDSDCDDDVDSIDVAAYIEAITGPGGPDVLTGLVPRLGPWGPVRPSRENPAM